MARATALIRQVFSIAAYCKVVSFLKGSTFLLARTIVSPLLYVPKMVSFFVKQTFGLPAVQDIEISGYRPVNTASQVFRLYGFTISLSSFPETGISSSVRNKGVYTPVHCTPIGHYKTFKSPHIPENFGQ